MGYRVIELTLCGGRDIFGHSDAKVVAQWLKEEGYLDKNNRRDADVYLIDSAGVEISARHLPKWCKRQLGETLLKRLKAAVSRLSQSNNC
ncbi:MAG: hypothetical protein H7A01_15030 [Hahellaceae bacterium]|nr:hypothetical protein [Hahellaceae bacterium]MCP5210371.1 hypothetical protein [Hahellaceae bacterium]